MLGERTVAHHVFQRDAAIHVLGDPVERLQVAQAALALFQVRLHHIARIAVPGMAPVALGQLVGNELGVLALHGLLLEQLEHVCSQDLVAADEPRVQH